MYQLYGDGIHDDYPAIQEMIDSGVCEVTLPVPKKHYLITQTLQIPSNFRLVLPRYAEIRLADGANCQMIRNRWVSDPAERLPNYLSNKSKKFNIFVNEASPAPEHVCENFEIIGGIWNVNNQNQKPNPMFIPDKGDPFFSGVCMLFYNVKNFKISNLTIKDPTTYAVLIDMGSYFTVEDITFDFNFGNPCAANMDGIHLDGNCHYGYIRNLKGACYDDLIALNAHEGSCGPITHIEIDGIFAEECHSAVRLLAPSEQLAHVHISNIHGTYYQYCIGITKYYSDPTKGPDICYDDISIDHVHASKAVRLPHLYPWPNSYVFPLIWVEGGITAKNIRIDTLARREKNVPVETIHIGEGAMIENLSIQNVSTENETGKPIPVLVNNGTVKTLEYTKIRTDGDEKLTGSGTIEHLIQD